MKTLAFAIGLSILTVGVAGLIAPASLVWIARRFAAPVDWLWYTLAVIRVAFGVLLLFVAKVSRAPKTLRVVAFIPLAAGLAIPFVGVERAQATVDWWSMQGPGLVRLTTIAIMALGGFIAYACAPSRRAA